MAADVRTPDGHELLTGSCTCLEHCPNHEPSRSDKIQEWCRCWCHHDEYRERVEEIRQRAEAVLYGRTTGKPAEQVFERLESEASRFMKVGIKKGTITVEFPVPIRGIELSPANAREMGQHLISLADDVEQGSGEPESAGDA